ncbi:YihY/virulence factor BrkB family protein [Rubrimonas sp.]|uniref:YihY/virulence factor BrkB family protein n=1 Tax=Rubrimonas sp. TaxID=2036015 RepID=UPI002FDCEE05
MAVRARIARLWRRLRAAVRVGWLALARHAGEDGDAMAAYIAYTAFLAVFPFAIFMTALIGVTISEAQAQSLIDGLFEAAPQHIAQTLEPVIFSVTQGASGRLLTISAVGALWVASSALEAVRVGFDRAYRAPTQRPFLRRRLVAMLCVLLAVGTFALQGLLMGLAPVGVLLAETALGVTAPIALTLVRWVVGLGIFALFLWELHVLLPSRRPPRRRLMPGIIVSTVLWGIGAGGFSYYLSLAPSYAITYGAFAGVIVTLLFFWLTGAAILIGAQVNGVLMRYRKSSLRDDLP